MPSDIQSDANSICALQKSLVVFSDDLQLTVAM
jgi:hypothetical protein